MSAKKKLIFCTYSSIYSSIVLDKLMNTEEIEVVAIINSTRVLRPSLNPVLGALYQLKTSGFRYSTYLFFITDVFRWIQAFLKKRNEALKSIHTLAQSQQIPVLDTRDINLKEATDFIQMHQPNILICAHFNQLLKSPVLDMKNLDCINIHPSLLPAYKGVDPVFYAMRDCTDKIGVTLHIMDVQFDTGEILLQSELELKHSDSLLQNNCQLFAEGGKLALQWINNKAELPLEKTQNTVSNDDNYDSWPTRTDIKQFKKAGNTLMTLSSFWKQL